MSDLAARTKAYVDALNASDIAAVAEIFADNCSLTDPNVTGLTPKSAVMAFIKEQFDAGLEHAVLNLRNVVTCENTTVTEIDLEAGDTVFSGCNVFEWEDGLIVSLRAYVNGMAAG